MNVNHLLKQTCTVSTAGAQDKFGKKAEGTPTSVACRFQKTHRVVATAQREVNSVDGLLWVPSNTLIDVDDKVTFAGNDYRVLIVEPMIDRKGSVRHYEVMVQDWSTQ